MKRCAMVLGMSLFLCGCGRGVKITDLKVGEGPEAKKGDILVVHYTGKLADGTVFDSTVEGRKPFEFNLGFGHVIAGWDRGVPGMRVGGKRRLVIPPSLAYGENGSPPAIPRNAELTFDIELLEIK
jgi:FKBP-type peptidyl-prolyl cis-trans isomerase